MSSNDIIPSREQVLENALRILLDGQERTGRQIAAEIKSQGIPTDKRLINSVLFSEGRAHVIYNATTHTYRIKEPVEGREPSQSAGMNEVVPLQATLKRFALHYTFSGERAGAAAFFRTEARGGEITIFFNEAHPFYSLLRGVVEKDISVSGECGPATETVLECLRVLLQGWAILENEQPSPKRSQLLQDVRLDWGRKVRELVGE